MRGDGGVCGGDGVVWEADSFAATPSNIDGRLKMTSDFASRSDERQRVDAQRKRSLPRLSRERYQGHAFVHWTLTIENRATGWLTQSFYHAWELVLLHANARYQLATPAYVLMRDHIHLLWCGVSGSADQSIAIEFLRRQLAPVLRPATWQHQAFDHVLRDDEREKDAVIAIANYILGNPVRANITPEWQAYPYAGCCVVGYPEMSITAPDYWERYWRCYNYLVEHDSP